METQKTSVKKIAMNYGLILGLASVLLSVIVYVMGQHLERPIWASLLGLGIMAVMIVYGLKAFKYENEGFLSLGEALKVGLAISLIAGIISALYNFVFISFIEPDFVNQMIEISKEQMLENNPSMTDDQMEMGLSITRKMMSPGIMSAMAVIFTLFIGFIFSLVAGLVMKQNRPE